MNGLVFLKNTPPSALNDPGNVKCGQCTANDAILWSIALAVHLPLHAVRVRHPAAMKAASVGLLLPRCDAISNLSW
jgi:hypothetical protein